MELPKLASSIADRGIFPAGEVGLFSTNDFDELASLPPLWEQEFTQLGRGRFDGRLFMAHTSRLVIGRESWSPGIHIRGKIPPSTVMFALPLHHKGPLVNRGAEVPDERAMFLFDDEPIDFLTPAPIEAFVMAVDRTLFERRAEAVLGRSLESLRQNDQVNLYDAKRLKTQLEDRIVRLEKSLLADSSRLRDPAGAAELETSFLDALLLALDVPAEARTKVDDGNRVGIEAERFLRHNVQHALRIEDVCAHVGTTERTLHATFRRQFGVTPKAYLKMLRLNAARRELKGARRGQTVTEIAARWDFLHFGWFSHDYQLMFGELPSETLHHHAH